MSDDGSRYVRLFNEQSPLKGQQGITFVTRKRGGKTLVISDFDGTIASNDMGHQIISRFAGEGWEEINRAYCAGELGSREAYLKAASLFRVGREELRQFILKYSVLDEYFVDFYRYCVAKEFDFKVVSDGLDFYIAVILETHGLGEIDFYANTLVFHGDRKLSIEFPHYNEECERCGNCKSSFLKTYRPLYGRIIYIGDGYSDVCPAMNADLVFAKSILYEKCVEHGKECIHYKNFNDIKDYLEKM